MQELKEINQIFKENEVPLWLNFGTLLGIYRDDKLIDDDIDLATNDLNQLWNKSKLTSIECMLCAQQYKVESYDLGMVVSKGNFRAGIGFYKVGKIPINPKVMYQENLPVMYLNHWLSKKFYYGFMRKKPTNLKYKIFMLLGGYYVTHAIPTFFICPLKKITFEREAYYIPNKTDEYLEYLYGPSWKTPDPDFPHFVTNKNINKFKGTFNCVMVSCPRCKHSFAKTKEEQKKPIVTMSFHCNKCGKNFKRRIFLKGIIQRVIK